MEVQARFLQCMSSSNIRTARWNLLILWSIMAVRIKKIVRALAFISINVCIYTFYICVWWVSCKEWPCSLSTWVNDDKLLMLCAFTPKDVEVGCGMSSNDNWDAVYLNRQTWEGIPGLNLLFYWEFQNMIHENAPTQWLLKWDIQTNYDMG